MVSGGIKDVIDVIFYEIIKEALAKNNSIASSYDLQEYENF